MSQTFWSIAVLSATLILTIPAYAQAPSCIDACQAKHDQCIVSCSNDPYNKEQGPACAQLCQNRHSECNDLCKRYPDRAMPGR
jgi:hypothetical protein